MTLRRLLLNFGSRSVDFRIGPEALGELKKLARGAVGVPLRCVVVTDGALAGEELLSFKRSLIDAGFTVSLYEVTPGATATLEGATGVFDAFGGAGLTRDDLVVALGAAPVCALAAFCAKLWCEGTPCLIVPTTLDAFVTAATAGPVFSTSATQGLVTLRPEPSLVLADTSFVRAAAPADRVLGYALLLGAHLADSKRAWTRFIEDAPRIAAGDELALIQAVCTSQTARRLVINAANPSSRHALDFGMTTARALRACLGEGPSWGSLVAEGMRFEARLGVEASTFSVDDMFAVDDAFADLGVDELAFQLDVDEFVAAIRSDQARRSNRQHFALPKTVGSIRLGAVDDELLRAHAEAFLASRAELLDEDAVPGCDEVSSSALDVR